jgi:hypothetical protein
MAAKRRHHGGTVIPGFAWAVSDIFVGIARPSESFAVE